MKTPKETSVLIAFEKSTATLDVKMEDVPQLAVQDLKTTCSVEKNKTSTQRTLQQLNVTECIVYMFRAMTL